MAAKAVATKATANKSFIDFKSVIFWVLAIVFFCYANSLTNGYNMDDEIVTINHPLTSKGLSAIPDILKSPYFQSDVYSYEYRPIVHISFAIEHQFLGESPFVSHLINLLLYLLLIYVAFDLLKRLFPAVNQTIIAAIVLVFALHPTHTEVVASIKNRDEILALLFSFLAWREAIKFTTTKQWWRILLVVVYFSLGMGSKITIISFVLLIPFSTALLLGSSASKTILLSLLLSLLGIIWIQSLNFNNQIIFIALILLGIVSFYILKNYKEVSNFFSPELSYKSIYKEEEIRIGFNNILNLIKSNLPFLLVTITIHLFFVYKGINGFSLLSLIGICIAIYLVVKSEINKNFWLIVIVLLSMEFMSLYESFYNSASTAIAIYLVIGYLFTKNKISKEIAISLIASIWIISFTKEISIFPSIFLLNFLVIRQFKFRWIFTSIVLSAFVFNMKNLLKLDYNENLFIYLDIIAIGLLNLLFLEKKNWEKHTKSILILYILVSIIIGIKTGRYSEITVINEKAKIEIYNKQVGTNVSIVPTQTYRPVLFAEFPIDLIKDELSTKVGTSAEVLLKYLKLTLIPYPLSFYYGYSEIKPSSIKNTLPIISIIFHILLLIVIPLTFKRNKLIAFGIILYLINIAPFSALITPIPGVMADRYLFAPTLGFAMVFIGLLTWLVKIDWASKLSGIAVFPKNSKYVLGSLLFVYASLTIARNNDWKDRLTLFRNDIIHVPNSAQAHNLLAYHLNRTAQETTDPFERKKLMEEAVLHFQRATEIWPDFMNATYDLGRTHEQLGNWNQAIASYKRTFEIDTSFSDAIFRIGIVYEAENKLDSAIISYKFVTEDNPQNITAFNNLSFCYFKKQEYRNAIETGRRSSFHHPTNTDPIVNIGKTFLHIKENDSALYYFEKVYPNRTDDKGLTEVLYKLWNEKGNIERATFYYRRMQIMGMVK